MIFFKKCQFSEWLLCGIFFLVLGPVFFPGPSAAAEMNDRLADCSKIENNTARLQCFDTLVGRKNPVPEVAKAATATMPLATIYRDIGDDRFSDGLRKANL